jgi:uncharacterized phage protein (TIGR01671 family)
MEEIMRSFRFRAWDKKNKIMLPVCCWEMGAVGYISTGSYDDIDGNEKTGGVVQEYEIMQYTGLEDRNGKRIYEGDIVEASFKQYYDHHPRHVLIKYEDGCFCAKEEIELYNFNSECKVVGNIYENPELMEEKHD